MITGLIFCCLTALYLSETQFSFAPAIHTAHDYSTAPTNHTLLLRWANRMSFVLLSGYGITSPNQRKWWSCFCADSRLDPPLASVSDSECEKYIYSKDDQPIAEVGYTALDIGAVISIFVFMTTVSLRVLFVEIAYSESSRNKIQNNYNSLPKIIRFSYESKCNDYINAMLKFNDIHFHLKIVLSFYISVQYRFLWWLVRNIHFTGVASSFYRRSGEDCESIAGVQRLFE